MSAFFRFTALFLSALAFSAFAGEDTRQQATRLFNGSARLSDALITGIKHDLANPGMLEITSPNCRGTSTTDSSSGNRTVFADGSYAETLHMSFELVLGQLAQCNFTNSCSGAGNGAALNFHANTNGIECDFLTNEEKAEYDIVHALDAVAIFLDGFRLSNFVGITYSYDLAFGNNSWEIDDSLEVRHIGLIDNSNLPEGTIIDCLTEEGEFAGVPLADVTSAEPYLFVGTTHHPGRGRDLITPPTTAPETRAIPLSGFELRSNHEADLEMHFFSARKANGGEVTCLANGLNLGSDNLLASGFES